MIYIQLFVRNDHSGAWPAAKIRGGVQFKSTVGRFIRRAWQIKDYDAILKVADKISLDILQEDPKLLMWFDQARIRVEQMTS